MLPLLRTRMIGEGEGSETHLPTPWGRPSTKQNPGWKGVRVSERLSVPDGGVGVGDICRGGGVTCQGRISDFGELYEYPSP